MAADGGQVNSIDVLLTPRSDTLMQVNLSLIKIVLLNYALLIHSLFRVRLVMMSSRILSLLTRKMTRFDEL